jgi:citrate lyase subunit beta/citryl-CoA lyase
MPAARPRRSVLYMPGSNPRALEKARTLAADALILDLEDAVAPDAKAEARRLVCEAVKAGGYGGRELIVRVNALRTSWGRADLEAVANSGAHAILIPKVDGADAVRDAIAVLDEAGGPADLPIWCMMETARGIMHAEEIATASSRVGCFVMGTSDLAKELHAAHTRLGLPMLAARSWCVLAARAAGISVVDGVHLDLNDEEGFHESCRASLELGMDGKTLIHPKQIDAANATFRPSEAVLAYSRKIIAAHAEAAAAGKGVVVVDGRLVENLHVEEAKRLVALDEAITALSA